MLNNIIDFIKNFFKKKNKKIKLLESPSVTQDIETTIPKRNKHSEFLFELKKSTLNVDVGNGSGIQPIEKLY